ncbi:MAG: hypothetical protein WAQ33_14940 [Gaiellaceae bacterium]
MHVIRLLKPFDLVLIGSAFATAIALLILVDQTWLSATTLALAVTPIPIYLAAVRHSRR